MFFGCLMAKPWLFGAGDLLFPMNVGLAEQTTASGLKTEWGEEPLPKRPKPVYEQLGSNSYTISGWQSYISSEGVETIRKPNVRVQTRRR